MPTTMITGIGGRLATLAAAALASQPQMRVVGIGRTLPPVSLDGVRLEQCDMRGDSVISLLRDAQADTLLHLDYADDDPAQGGASGHGTVFRAIEVLGAASAAGISRVVLRSSTLVYGADPASPAFLSESAPVVASPRAGPLRDYAEIERVASELAASPAAPRITVVRCAPIVGAGIDTPLGRYLTRQRAPVMLGFDPRMQVLHAHDAAVALALAVLAEEANGPINVAADPPLTLGKAIHLAGGGTLPLPEPVFTLAERSRDGPLPGVEALAAAATAPMANAVGELPFDTGFLRYGCVADTRRAQQLIAWQPQHSAEQALRELARR